MSSLPVESLDAHQPLHTAVRAMWKPILLASLLGIFLAELCVMLLLDRLHLPWGWPAALLDATLLTILILPGLYLVVLRPVAELTARLAAAAAQARFRTVLEAAADAIVVSDLEGRIRYVNPATLRMLGYSQGELDGAEVALLVPDELRQRHREGMRRFLSTGSSHIVDGRPVELEALARDGTRIPVELSLVASTLAPGDRALVAVIRDVRERRRLGLYEALLPVCSMCKRIRDDADTNRGEGDWSSLENYVERRASARFSHTFCPGCLEEYRRSHGLGPAVPMGRSA